jgi:hypothetical protein
LTTHIFLSLLPFFLVAEDGGFLLPTDDAANDQIALKPNTEKKKRSKVAAVIDVQESFNETNDNGLGGSSLVDCNGNVKRSADRRLERERMRLASPDGSSNDTNSTDDDGDIHDVNYMFNSLADDIDTNNDHNDKKTLLDQEKEKETTKDSDAVSYFAWGQKEMEGSNDSENSDVEWKDGEDVVAVVNTSESSTKAQPAGAEGNAGMATSKTDVQRLDLNESIISNDYCQGGEIMEPSIATPSVEQERILVPSSAQFKASDVLAQETKAVAAAENASVGQEDEDESSVDWEDGDEVVVETENNNDGDESLAMLQSVEETHNPSPLSTNGTKVDGEVVQSNNNGSNRNSKAKTLEQTSPTAKSSTAVGMAGNREMACSDIKDISMEPDQRGNAEGEKTDVEHEPTSNSFKKKAVHWSTGQNGNDRAESNMIDLYVEEAHRSKIKNTTVTEDDDDEDDDDDSVEFVRTSAPDLAYHTENVDNNAQRGNGLKNHHQGADNSTTSERSHTKDERSASPVEDFDLDWEDGDESSKEKKAMKDGHFSTSDAALEQAQATASNLTDWAGRAFRRAMEEHLGTKISAQKKPVLETPLDDAKSNNMMHVSPAKSPEKGHADSDTKSFSSSSSPLQPKRPLKETEESNPNVVSENNNSTASAGNTVQVNPSNEGWKESYNNLQAEVEQDRLDSNRAQRDMETMTDDMKEEIMQLLQLFGVPYVEAPAEAEAQCVALEQLGLVNGIVTEDSDVFVFGGQEIYKNIFDERKYVEVYRSSDADRELGLAENDMVALAMLLGGDYTGGVKGVGIVNGMEVLQAFPTRDDLQGGLTSFRKWLDGFDPSDAMNDDTPSLFTNFETPEVKQFHKKHKSARTRWIAPADFPAANVLTAYTKPVVDKSRTPFSWGTPDVEHLRHFCRAKIGWDAAETDKAIVPVLDKMKSGMRQTRLDSFFMSYKDDIKFANVRSERLRSVMHKVQKKKASPKK